MSICCDRNIACSPSKPAGLNDLGDEFEKVVELGNFRKGLSVLCGSSVFLTMTVELRYRYYLSKCRRYEVRFCSCGA
jgi:hypothetical protein